MMNKKFALVAVGELLADLIGTELAESLTDTPHFQRFQGGSPSNLAANMARLGGQTAIVSCVGNDNLGRYLVAEVAKTGVYTTHIAIDDLQPSSIVLVARSQATPDFIAYRTADRMLLPQHLPDSLLADAAIYHTTCFALSQNPAQTTIVDGAERAAKLGCKLSIDLNYAPSIWPNRAEAMQIISSFLGHGALVKLSEDDAERLYGKPMAPEDVIVDLHAKGASLICFTMGAKGSLISTNQGEDIVMVPGRSIQVVDSTGAGDSYWSGFLTALLDGHDPETCARAGANIAALKLSMMGPLPSGLDKKLLYQ